MTEMLRKRETNKMQKLEGYREREKKKQKEEKVFAYVSWRKRKRKRERDRQKETKKERHTLKEGIQKETISETCIEKEGRNKKNLVRYSKQTDISFIVSYRPILPRFNESRFHYLQPYFFN